MNFSKIKRLRWINLKWFFHIHKHSNTATILDLVIPNRHILRIRKSYSSKLNRIYPISLSFDWSEQLLTNFCRQILFAPSDCMIYTAFFFWMATMFLQKNIIQLIILILQRYSATAQMIEMETSVLWLVG